MKFLFILFCLLNNRPQNSVAENGNNAVREQDTLKVVLVNDRANCSHKDSVFVMLDKFDHSGAGVVKKMFNVSADHSFVVTGLPAGHYFITIRCLGLHRDIIEKTIRVVKKKNNIIKVHLKDCEEFVKSEVTIPNQPVNFSKLSVVTFR